MPKSTVQFKVFAEKKEFDEICRQSLLAMPKCILSETAEGFVLKEEKTDLLKGTYAAEANITFADGLVTIQSTCGGIGPFQKKHVDEFGQLIKGMIKRSICEKQTGKTTPDDMVRCPKCGSTQIQLQKRGWTLATGLIASGMNERVCLNCLYKF